MKTIAFAVLASASALALAAPASAQVVNFDTIDTFTTVDSYYAGGTSGTGQTGPDLGIVFQTGDWITTTQYGQTSSPNLAYSASGAGYVNFLAGITTGLNFSYGAFANSSLSIYDGLSGSGTLLGTFQLAQNDPYNFDFVALPFSGIAHSVVITSGETQFGWDDLTFGSLTPGAIPEPATWALMLLGFGLVGAAMRRRTTATIAFAS